MASDEINRFKDDWDFKLRILTLNQLTTNEVCNGPGILLAVRAWIGWLLTWFLLEQPLHTNRVGTPDCATRCQQGLGRISARANVVGRWWSVHCRVVKRADHWLRRCWLALTSTLGVCYDVLTRLQFDNHLAAQCRTGWLRRARFESSPLRWRTGGALEFALWIDK